MDWRGALDDLAATTGVAVERLQRWRDLGLLAVEGSRSAEEEAERVRLIDYAVEHGIDAEQIARIDTEQGDLLDGFVRQLHRPGRGRTLDSVDAAAMSGLPPAVLERMWNAGGLRDQSRAFVEDVEAMRSAALALEFGLPEDALIQLIRVLATSQAKVAEAAGRLVHFYVHERFRAEGRSGAELIDSTRAVADPLASLLEPAILYFHRKAWERETMQDMLLHLREEAIPPSAIPGEVDRTVLFVDLSSFTPLSEAMGDAVAADVLERFGEMVRDASLACEGEVVKQIGDEFMLVFRTPEAALTCGLEIERKASAMPRFPAVRMGAHTGSVLYREGDYVGMTINIAARVAAAADRHQLIVTRALRDAAQVPGVDYEPLGKQRLKGIADEVELFHVSRAGERPALTLDPVCGMELDEASTEARLHWQGELLAFCSTGCLRRFLDDPDRFVPSSA